MCRKGVRRLFSVGGQGQKGRGGKPARNAFGKLVFACRQLRTRGARATQADEFPSARHAVVSALYICSGIKSRLQEFLSLVSRPDGRSHCHNTYGAV